MGHARDRSENNQHRRSQRIGIKENARDRNERNQHRRSQQYGVIISVDPLQWTLTQQQKSQVTPMIETTTEREMRQVREAQVLLESSRRYRGNQMKPPWPMLNQMCEYEGVAIDDGVNEMSTLLPTPKTSNKSKCCVTNNMYEHAAKSLLKTITFELEDIKKWAILDSGATSNFLLSDAPVDEERCTQNPITAKLPDGKKV